MEVDMPMDVLPDDFDKTPRNGELRDQHDEIRLCIVDDAPAEALWNQIVREYHYLGYESTIGARVQYIIKLGSQVIGAISFCSAAYKLGPRDTFIGWDANTRQLLLQHLAQNNRFLILPWIQIHNLATHVLSLSMKNLRVDWKERYGLEPYLVETFVDRERFMGTIYKAANWIHLGTTQGYGKRGKGFIYHGNKKDIYVYVLDRPFSKRFQLDLRRSLFNKEDLSGGWAGPDNTEGIEEMATNGLPTYFPDILHVIGLVSSTIDRMSMYLLSHLSRYFPFLGRKEQQAHMVAMEKGILSDLTRKSIEPIAKAFEGHIKVRGLTNFLSIAQWKNDDMLKEYQTELSEFLAGDAKYSMITGDESAFKKKGNHSVGVARQYDGNRGKTDNCQVGEFVGYVSPDGYGLVDYQLFMPHKWFGDDYAEKRDECGVPDELVFENKNDMMKKLILDTIKCKRAIKTHQLMSTKV